MKWSFTYSHKRHGVSNLRQFSCVFNSLFEVTAKKTNQISIISYWLLPFESTCGRFIPFANGQLCGGLFYESINPYHLTHDYPTTTSALYIAGLSICIFPFTAQTHQYFPGNVSIGHYLWCCNSNIFSHENAFENFVLKMAAIMPRPQCDCLLDNGHRNRHYHHYPGNDVIIVKVIKVNI